MENPVTVAAIVAAIVSSLVQLVIAGVRGAFRLYEVRRGRTFEGALVIEVDGWIRNSRQGSFLHYQYKVSNIGNVRVDVGYSILEVRQTSVENEEGGWIWEPSWGEPASFEPFSGDEVPTGGLNPGASVKGRRSLGLSSLRPPLKLTLWVVGEEGAWYAVNEAVQVVSWEVIGDNEG